MWKMVVQPKILDNQVQREILTTVGSIPFMTLLTTPIFLAEVRSFVSTPFLFALLVLSRFVADGRSAGARIFQVAKYLGFLAI